MSKAIVLFSGGMDSVIALYHTLTRPDITEIFPMTFRYGQRHVAELHAARTVLEGTHGGIQKLIPTRHIMLDVGSGTMPATGSLMRTDIDVDKYSDVTSANRAGHRDRAFIPHRNLLFFTVAAMWAHAIGADEIVSGIRGGFPDCTEEYEDHVCDVLNMGLSVSDRGKNLILSSPVHITRADSIKLAMSIPGCYDALAYSMTCFMGTEPPCGHCLPCLKRSEGFALAGIDDPLLTRLRKGAAGGARGHF